jgi:hypothetical protein
VPQGYIIGLLVGTGLYYFSGKIQFFPSEEKNFFP